MIFGRKKTKIWEMLNTTYNSLEDCGKDAVCIFISFFDYGIQTIDSTIIKSLENEMNIILNQKIRETIYQFVFNSLDLGEYIKFIVPTPTKKTLLL